jgi:alkanesulfonate monooxygenase SsuD/methylene tetrahydromethanopterin reductase-like flavin-dependent oxidoreductase (luciferase family)
VNTSGTTERLRNLSAAAEALGVSGLWACDHLFWHQPILEPMTTLAVAASASTTAVLGTCVLQLPLRNPAAVARQAGTLQTMASGRFVLGLGVGSHPGEYEAAGVDFSRRGRLLDEGIATLRRAWGSGGDKTQRYRQDPPVPAVPVWLAGSSDAAVSRAARVGDGWVPLFLPAAEYGSTRRRLFDLAANAGRDAAELDTAAVVVLCIGDSAEVARKAGALWLAELYDLPPKAFERHVIAGPAEHCAAAVSEYHDAGASHVVVMVAADETLDHLGPLLEALPHPASEPSGTTRLPPTAGVAP